MAQLNVQLDVQALTTAKARYKHLISRGAGRTWCNQIDAGQATAITPLLLLLAGDWHNGMCPKCLHYLTWLEANSKK